VAIEADCAFDAAATLDASQNYWAGKDTAPDSHCQALLITPVGH